MPKIRRADPPRMAVVWFEIAKAIAQVHDNQEANFVGPYICNIAKVLLHSEVINWEELRVVDRAVDEERHLQQAEYEIDDWSALWYTYSSEAMSRVVRLRWVTDRIRGLPVAHLGRIPSTQPQPYRRTP